MEVRNLEEKVTMAVRVTVAVEDLPKALGDGYGEIMGYLASRGVQPSGMPFAMYYNMDMHNLDVEMGLPVAEPLEGQGRIGPGTLPGGKAVVEMHVGPYEKLEETYRKVMDYIEREGLQTESYMYESYLNDPGEVAPEELKTEIVFPIKE